MKRKKALWNSRAATYALLLDGKKFTRLRNGEEVQLSIGSGIHAVQLQTGIEMLEKVPGMLVKSDELAVKVEPGENVTLVCWPSTWGGITLKRGDS